MPYLLQAKPTGLVRILTALCLLGIFFFTLFNYTHSEYTLWGSCKVR